MKKDIKYLLKLLLCFILFFNLSYLIAMLFNLVGIKNLKKIIKYLS